MAKVKKIRGAGEYNRPASWDVHQDAIESLKRMSEQFRGYYRRKHLVTFGILLIEKEIKRKGIKPGDDVEEALDIQTDQH